MEVYDSWDEYLLSRRWGRVLTGRMRNSPPEEMTPERFLSYFALDTRLVVVPGPYGKEIGWIVLFSLRELASYLEYNPVALIRNNYSGVVVIVDGSKNEMIGFY